MNPARIGLAAVSGLLYAAAFTPDATGWLAIPAIAGFALLSYVVSCAHTAPRAALMALIFGLFAFTPGLSWVHKSLNVYGGIPSVIAWGLVVLLALANTAFVSASAALSWTEKNRALRAALVFPASFVFFEWLRGTALTSFPFLQLGYAMSDSPLAGFAPVFGVYGCALAGAVTAGCLAAAAAGWHSVKLHTAALGGAAITLAAGAALSFVTWSTPCAVPVRVALAQPDLPLSGVASVPPMTNGERISITASLTRGDDASPRIVIWPESVLTTTLQRLPAPALRMLTDQMLKPGETLIFNALTEERRGVVQNSLIVGEDDHVSGRYDKRHLVPFGERIPSGYHFLMRSIGIPFSDMTPGENTQKPIQLENGAVFAPMICYENAFGDELITFWKTADPGREPNALLLSSNLGWFSPLIRYQHLLFSRMRALETSRPLLSANNNGSSAIISSQGEIVSHCGTEQTALTATVFPEEGAPTPFVRFGNAPAVTLSLLILLAAAGRFFLSRKRTPPKESRGTLK